MAGKPSEKRSMGRSFFCGCRREGRDFDWSVFRILPKLDCEQLSLADLPGREGHIMIATEQKDFEEIIEALEGYD